MATLLQMSEMKALGVKNEAEMFKLCFPTELSRQRSSFLRNFGKEPRYVTQHIDLADPQSSRRLR
jgi:hypothetical protein